MSHQSMSSWTKKNDHSPLRHSPLRHASNVSNSSSEDGGTAVSASENLPPTRIAATPSSTPGTHKHRRVSGQKRPLRDTSPSKSSSPDYQYSRQDGSPPSQSRSRRPSLKAIPQGSNMTVPPSQVAAAEKTAKQSQHYNGTEFAPTPAYGTFNAPQSRNGQSKQQLSMALSRSDSVRAPTSKSASRSTDASAESQPLDGAEVEKWGRSTTSHLRTLSKFAQNGESEFKITSPEQEVIGMHGRRRLQRDMSQRGKKTANAPGYGGRTWMDQQRQFLQAYEYLCHIGEAKEWIEDIIHKPIPPIVQLEEALRDGVTLAEVVQAINPDRPLRIFQHPRLQFRHSDNIALFFKFLNQVELPELFRFELVDLYEKKNIPKVIYCIHALSWLLFRKGIVDFRIGNLVGQLEFEQHELETTQKGLDKAGVSMPNFSGMSEKLGAEPAPEPEPEPVETEEERIERELFEAQDTVSDLQTQVRGALLRLKLGELMQQLWDGEDFFTNLQARIRGDFARQISSYRLEMKHFAVNLQKISRGFIVRSNHTNREELWKAKEKQIILLQSLARSRAAKAQTQTLKSKIQLQQHGIKQLQAAVRGALHRWKLNDHLVETQHVEPAVVQLQALARAFRVKRQQSELARDFRNAGQLFTNLQSHAKAQVVRKRIDESQRDLKSHSSNFSQFQALLKGHQQRKRFFATIEELQSHEQPLQVFQSAIRSFAVRRAYYSKLQRLDAQSDQVKFLQAACRGGLERRRIDTLSSEAEAHTEALSTIQAFVKANLLRSEISDQLDKIYDEEDAIIALQSIARASHVRSHFAEKQEYFNENMKKVIKIQSYVRGRQQGQAYKSLTTGKNPPVGTVKNFVHLLNDSDFDFEEELESEKLQKALVQKKQQNEQTEQCINDVDAKIGLLAHTKIASDELARMRKQTLGSASSAMARQTSVKDSFNLKALNKSSRVKLDRYQELFFIIQTQPQYLARLFRRAREQGLTDQDQRKLELLTMSTFAHAQKRREEYLFLKLIARSVKEEASSCGSIQDYLRGTYFFNRLFNAHTKGPKDRQYLKKLYGGLVTSWFIENSQLDLESDPLQIHRALINDEELRTGRRSQQDLDIPKEEAIKDPRIRSVFISHLQDMRSIVEDFFTNLEEAVHRMPYGTRFLAREMFHILQAKFSREDEHYIYQLVGSWLWKNYLKPAIFDPEGNGVVDRTLEPKQRKNLMEFLKIINQISAGRLFTEDNPFLGPLNPTVEESIGRFVDVVAEAIDVPAAEQKFDISEFNDLYAKVKPTLYIRLSDVFMMHQMLADDISIVCPSHEDSVLRNIVRDLGNARSNESEIGAGSGEVTLSLGGKFHAPQDPDAEVKALFMETKRCILYIIRVQAGANLLDVMVKPITEEDESRWELLIQDEMNLHGSSRKRTAYTDGPTNELLDIASMSYSELKRIALENILSLEKSGRLSRHNHYQDILNEIAVDIRNKHRRRVQRQRELESIRTTIAHLDEKQAWLDDRLKVYNDTFEQNLAVLQGKSAKGLGKGKFVMPFSKQWHHNREMERLGREPRYGSYKRSAEQFMHKGILISWNGRDLRNDDLTISSDEINYFLIEGSSGTMMITGASAYFTWNHLLEAEYDGKDTIEFFGMEADENEGEGETNGNRSTRRKKRSKNGVLVLDRAAFKAWMTLLERKEYKQRPANWSI